MTGSNNAKFIAAEGEGVEVLEVTNAIVNGKSSDEGVITSKKTNMKLAESFIAAMGNHRYWDRE